MDIGSRRLGAVLQPRGTAAFMALAGAVGVAAGLSAVLLISAIAVVLLAVDGMSGGAVGPWTLVVLPLGLLLSLALTRWLAPEASGGGIPQVIAALIVRGGHLPARLFPVKVLATALTIGTGGSVGREGPIAQMGAVLGSTAGRWMHLGEDQVRSLLAAGAGAGIAATFNAPIAGMLFAMEVLLGRFSIRHLNAVVVACVAAAVTSRTLLGEQLIFQVSAYPLNSAWELLPYAALGLLAVATGYLFLRSLDWWDRLPEQFRGLPAWLVTLVGGGVVAVLGLLRPEILGSGQQFVGSLLRGQIELSWWLLFVLALLKAMATSITFGARGSGGIFMPSLFIGATLGGGFAELLAPFWNVSALIPEAFALVGMAASFSAVARAPLTSILIVFEITGDYRLVLPLMLATSLATFLADRIHPESAYTMPLARRGIRPTRTGEVDLLDTVLVGDVMSDNPAVVHADMTTGEVQGI
ncbi:MAG: chloride channel protein, partial [Actinomycetota bacterium]|nr:chloride channel protein [Actinomycetota bacterium]